jgi:hypothetical protein
VCRCNSFIEKGNAVYSTNHSHLHPKLFQNAALAVLTYQILIASLNAKLIGPFLFSQLTQRSLTRSKLLTALEVCNAGLSLASFAPEIKCIVQSDRFRLLSAAV